MPFGDLDEPGVEQVAGSTAVRKCIAFKFQDSVTDLVDARRGRQRRAK